MAIVSVLNSTATVKRFTYKLFDKDQTVSSVSLDRQPQQSCRLLFNVSGATITTGTIAISGSTNETLTFVNNGSQFTTKDFSSVSGIVLAGISNGYLDIDAITKTGQKINQEEVIYTNIPIRIFKDTGKSYLKEQGHEQDYKLLFMFEPDKIINNEDLIYASSNISGMTKARVSFVESIVDFSGATHHIEGEMIPL